MTDGRPLSLCLCCQLNLAAMVIQMTANLDGNFDETATHLVATSIGSQKYYAALQIGIPIVTPDFIYEARQRWIEDKAINPKELLHLHSLRPFQTLRIGICGVTKPEKRQALRAKVEELGGTVAMPMTFDSGVTHLLCGTTDIKNSATLSSLYQIKAGRAGTKEERRGAEMIKCVRPCWIEDCEKVGGECKTEMMAGSNQAAHIDTDDWCPPLPLRSYSCHSRRSL